MYLEEYSLYAVPAILVTGAVTWLYLKVKGRAEKSNVRSLVLSTAVAILIALLVPVTARLFYHEVGLPVMASAVAAFISLVILAGAVSFLVTRLLRKKAQSAGLQKAFGYAAEESAAGEEDSQVPDEEQVLEKTEGKTQPDEEQAYETPAYEEREDEERGDMEGTAEAAHAESIGYFAGAESTDSAESLYGTEPVAPPEVFADEEVDTLQNIDKIGDKEHGNAHEDPNDLLGAAMDCKMRGDFHEAVSFYLRALEHIHDKELKALVILDLCSLAKRMKNTRMIRDILDSGHGKMLDDEIRDEILANI